MLNCFNRIPFDFPHRLFKPLVSSSLSHSASKINVTIGYCYNLYPNNIACPTL
jgi:hypothetical protein